MSEVLDRPPVHEKAPVEEKQAVKPPGRYHIEAWSGGHVCAAKFAQVVHRVFDVPQSVAFQLANAFRTNPRLPVAMGLSKDVAETKADQAERELNDLVGGCPCGHRAKFVPIPEDE